MFERANPVHDRGQELQKRSTDRAAIGTWLRELEAEVGAVGDEAGVVIHKRRGTTDVGEYVVIMPVKYLNHLLTATYKDHQIVRKKSGDRRRSIPRSDDSGTVI